MNLRVIEGGLAALHADDMAGLALRRAPQRIDVEREAARRLARLGYDRWRNRQQGTGIPMPRTVHYSAIQIEFVASTLSALAPIPADFRSDIYWPA